MNAMFPGWLRAFGPRQPRSSLGRHAAVSPMSPEEFSALRCMAWTERGIIVISIDEVADDWLKQALINLATKLFGKRMKK